MNSQMDRMLKAQGLRLCLINLFAFALLFIAQSVNAGERKIVAKRDGYALTLVGNSQESGENKALSLKSDDQISLRFFNVKLADEADERLARAQASGVPVEDSKEADDLFFPLPDRYRLRLSLTDKDKNEIPLRSDARNLGNGFDGFRGQFLLGFQRDLTLFKCYQAKADHNEKLLEELTQANKWLNNVDEEKRADSKWKADPLTQWVTKRSDGTPEYVPMVNGEATRPLIAGTEKLRSNLASLFVLSENFASRGPYTLKIDYNVIVASSPIPQKQTEFRQQVVHPTTGQTNTISSVATSVSSRLPSFTHKSVRLLTFQITTEINILK